MSLTILALVAAPSWQVARADTGADATARWSWPLKIIAADGTSHKLDYVMRNTASGWKVVDVLADGSISRVAVQRSDFRELLNSGGPPALMAGLQRKVASLSGGMLA